MTGGAISWHSRIQDVTAAGTTEGEYVALAENVNEVRFLPQVQAFIMPKLDYYIVRSWKITKGRRKWATASTVVGGHAKST